MYVHRSFLFSPLAKKTWRTFCGKNVLAESRPTFETGFYHIQKAVTVSSCASSVLSSFSTGKLFSLLMGAICNHVLLLVNGNPILFQTSICSSSKNEYFLGWIYQRSVKKYHDIAFFSAVPMQFSCDRLNRFRDYAEIALFFYQYFHCASNTEFFRVITFDLSTKSINQACTSDASLFF